jgi:hypothetical protein
MFLGYNFKTGRAMSNKAPKQAKSKSAKRRAIETKGRISPLAVVLGVATLIGGCAAIVTFFPRVTPSVSDPYDPNDPFSSTITITNTGYLPLGSVEAFVGLNELHTRDAAKGPTYRHEGTRGKYARFAGGTWKAHYLGLDDRFSFLLNDVIAPGFGVGNMAVIIDYEIPIIHMKREKIFPLLSKRRPNGTFYWAFDTE